MCRLDLLKEQLEQLRNENAALAPDVKAARAAWLSNTDPQQEPKLEKVYQDLSEKDKQLNSRRAELEAKLPSAGERSPLKQGVSGTRRYQSADRSVGVCLVLSAALSSST
jgi:chromosome segregation ATPase